MIVRGKAAPDYADSIGQELDRQEWRSEGKRAQENLNPRFDPQLFPKLSPEALSGTFTGLELSTREFP